MVSNVLTSTRYNNVNFPSFPLSFPPLLCLSLYYISLSIPLSLSLFSLISVGFQNTAYVHTLWGVVCNAMWLHVDRLEKIMHLMLYDHRLKAVHEDGKEKQKYGQLSLDYMSMKLILLFTGRNGAQMVMLFRNITILWNIQVLAF